MIIVLDREQKTIIIKLSIYILLVRLRCKNKKGGCMKKLVTLAVCLFITASLLGVNNADEAVTQWTNLGESKALWEILDDLNDYEKKNALIGIELTEISEETTEQASLIEDRWNSGDYEGAIELLKYSPDLQDACIGIQWKEPIKTSVRWGDDVQIGSREDISVVSLDVDNTTGHLFVALLHNADISNHRWSVCFSSDTGKTWSETFNWLSTSTNIYDVDGVVHGDYFYVGYLANLSGTYTGKIRRFYNSTGLSDGTYGNKTPIDEGVLIRDIDLASNADLSDNRIYYWAIMGNDSLRYYWSDQDAETWGSIDPGIGNADRGLDTGHDPNGDERWASYVGTDNSLYAVERSPWVYHGPFDYVGTNSNARTSIATYRDTIMITYPHYDGSYYNFRYIVSYDDGSTWISGILASPSENIGIMNDITGRNGDGFGVVYQNQGIAAEGFYRHRGYPVSPGWTSPVSFADSVTRYNVKPSIERVALGLYGIVYANYPDEHAYYDRSDLTGVDETEITTDDINLSIDKNVFSRSSTIQFYLPNSHNVSLKIIDQLGRTVKSLVNGIRPAGTHYVTWYSKNNYGEIVPNGIYFAVLKADENTKTKKLILMK